MVDLEQEEDALRYLLENYERTPEIPDVPFSVFKERYGRYADVVTDLLMSDELIEIKRKVQKLDERHSAVVNCLIPTAKGRTYFLKQQREARISRKQFIQSAVIAVISAIISSLLTLLASHKSESSSEFMSSSS